MVVPLLPHGNRNLPQKRKKASEETCLVPVVGFELTTYRLQGGCSTN